MGGVSELQISGPEIIEITFLHTNSFIFDLRGALGLLNVQSIQAPKQRFQFVVDWILPSYNIKQ